jgi:uracil-DNA glycosylase family 4
MARPKTRPSPALFDPDCRRCPRIARHLAAVRKSHPGYHARPVAPFGETNPDLLIVGLGPGMHGANATGRPFTGDYAGILLYQTLFDYGFSNRPESKRKGDGLRLKKCRITNAVKCLPPDNKPKGEEVRACNAYLRAELQAIPGRLVILALGKIAHDAVLRALDRKQKDYPFSHNATHAIAARRWLVDSYHCSRYNTQTGRLTPDMFRDVFDNIHELLNLSP